MTALPQLSGFDNLQVLTEYKDLLSVQDLSIIFKTSKQTIHKEMKTGKSGTPIKISRLYRIVKIYLMQ